MKALVISEHTHTTLTPATRSAVAAALQMGGTVDIYTPAPYTVAQQAAACGGVTRVLWAESEGMMLAEVLAPAISTLAADYTHILLPATTTGKDLAPRIASLLDIQQISDITAVVAPDIFTRPIYAGNALETLQSLQPRHVITIRPTSFEAVVATGGSAEIVVLPALDAAQGITQLIAMEASVSARPELTAARIVVSGGRALASKENFALIEALADKLGAAVGASRAAVDAGYISNDHQVGQTGKIVAPALYIAVGISGAIQHLAGMKESKVIVAINKDENAPIFDVADYGLVGDLFAILPELTEKLS
jgi:electron transfer flavoprotein alpha subunit